MSEQITDEQQADAQKPKRPRGAPQLVPYTAVNRRTRAALWRHLAPVMEVQERLAAAGLDAGAEVPASFGADVMEMAADVEDALRVLAVEPDAFEAWAIKSDDGDLLSLLVWYLDRFQVGEATASSS